MVLVCGVKEYYCNICHGRKAMKKKTIRYRETKQELQQRIELLDEAINDGDVAVIEQNEVQKEYKKRYGKEYEY